MMQRLLLTLAAVLITGRGAAQDAAPLRSTPSFEGIVDTHIHLYDPQRESGVPWPPADDEVLYKPHLPNEFAQVAKPAGVSAVIVVEASDRLDDNRWVLRLTADDDFYVGLVGNVDPHRDDFAEQVDRLRTDPRFVGVRVHAMGGKTNFRDEQVLSSLAQLAQREITLDVLMNGEGLDTIREVDRVARRLPELKIVMNHVLGYNVDGAAPPAEWAAAVKRLAENRNVYCKISGLYQRSIDQPAPHDLRHYRPLLDVLWEAFGEDRLIYGSNWPVTKKSGDYASYVRLVDTYFSTKGASAREKYFRQNAIEAYRLPVHRPNAD